MTARLLFNFEAFALFVHMRMEQPRHMVLTEAAEQSGVTKAQLFRALHKQPINNGAFLALCVWLNINPFAFLLDAGTGRGLAALPPVDVPRETSTETRPPAAFPKRRAA